MGVKMHNAAPAVERGHVQAGTCGDFKIFIFLDAIISLAANQYEMDGPL